MAICNHCTTSEATIRYHEKDYCLDCYTSLVIRKKVNRSSWECPEEFTVIDKDGSQVTFEISFLYVGRAIQWNAQQIGGDYHFRYISDIEDSFIGTIMVFCDKIIDGVRTKTIDSHRPFIRKKGNINIVENPENGISVLFEIDGVRYTPEEFGILCSAHTDQMLQFCIQDPTGHILNEDEYLEPIHITKDKIIEEVQVLIQGYCPNRFLSSRDGADFSTSVGLILIDLEILMHSEYTQDAVAAGKELINRIMDLDTDDCYYLETNIEKAAWTIDPLAVDQALWEKIEQWENRYDEEEEPIFNELIPKKEPYDYRKQHRVGIISDTHGMLRPEVIEKLQGCELILHAGDIGKKSVLEELEKIAPVKAVRGNADKEWASDLPKILDFELYDQRIIMAHNKKDIPDNVEPIDIVIYGHTHKYDDRFVDDVRYINPGCCGKRAANQEITMIIMYMDARGWELHDKIVIPHSKK